MDDHIYPNEAEYHEQLEALGHDGDPPLLEKLKAAARERGLWNMFLPHLSPDAPGTKLSNLDYSPISEQLGKVGFASEALNCSAPDTGNMEILNAVRLRDREARLARTAARRRDPFCVLHDRARVGIVGRDEHQPAHRQAGQRLRVERHEVVLVRCDAAALQGADRHGQDRPERGPALAAVDDRRAQGHARRSVRSHAARVRLRPRGRPSRGGLRGRPRAGRQPARRGGWRLRDVAGSARSRAASITACARSVWPSARSGS